MPAAIKHNNKSIIITDIIIIINKAVMCHSVQEFYFNNYIFNLHNTGLPRRVEPKIFGLKLTEYSVRLRFRGLDNIYMRKCLH